MAVPETIAEQVLLRVGDEGLGLVTADASFTHAQVTSAAFARAGWLNEMRRPGPFHVAVLLDNVADYVFWLEAAALVGAVVVGANSTHRGAELARDLTHTRCQLLVTSHGLLPLVDGLVMDESLGTVTQDSPRVFVVDGNEQRDLAKFAGFTPDPLAAGVTPDSLGYLLFTSGTSGAPKACRCTQGRLARIGAIVAQMFSITNDDVCYLSMPLFHSNALMAGWGPTLAAGATAALPSGGKFSASGFLPDVRRFGATYFNYVGKPLAYVLATPEQPDDADNTLRRAFGNEGASADVERFAARFGCQVTDAYGSTEGGASVSRTPDTPRGALGVSGPDTVVLDAGTGEECPRARFDEHGILLNAEEAIGELVSKGGGAGFEGYWDNEEAERVRLRNGWYWTGDLAYRDEAGFIYFAGRDHDWLRVDGENFASAPVERIMERFEDVVLAAVYAVPDPVVGDQVMASLQLRDGAAFDPAVFEDFLAQQEDLGPKWTPRFVRLAVMPMTATNKVVKRALRAERWNTDDPVFWRPEKSRPFERLSPADRQVLDEAVADRPI